MTDTALLRAELIGGQQFTRPERTPHLRALVDRLGARYQTIFDVTQTVDPELIGGVRITLGDKLIDGSVAGRLDELARMLSTN